MKAIVVAVLALLLFLPVQTLELAEVQPIRQETIDPWVGYEELKTICTCESGLIHEVNGKVVRGQINSEDIGICQINRFYHGKRATSLGLDLMIKEDNIAFAKLLFNEQGSRPWNWSRSCWEKSVN